MPVNVDVVDRRTIKVEFPADPAALAKILRGLPADMALVGGSAIMSGTQRDHVVSLSLVAERVAIDPEVIDGAPK